MCFFEDFIKKGRVFNKIWSIIKLRFKKIFKECEVK